MLQDSLQEPEQDEFCSQSREQLPLGPQLAAEKLQLSFAAHAQLAPVQLTGVPVLDESSPQATEPKITLKNRKPNIRMGEH